jgi:hypothetical protein
VATHSGSTFITGSCSRCVRLRVSTTVASGGYHAFLPAFISWAMLASEVPSVFYKKMVSPHRPMRVVHGPEHALERQRRLPVYLADSKLGSAVGSGPRKLMAIARAMNMLKICDQTGHKSLEILRVYYCRERRLSAVIQRDHTGGCTMTRTRAKILRRHRT